MVNTFFNSIMVSSSDEITFLSAVIAMGIALVMGLIIGCTYMKTQKDYQQSFVVTLAMLPVILAVIILFIGSNVARAFSMAGTLSIIRFRSAPGDPKDIGYIFFDVAAGLACGVGLYGYGILFVAVLCLFMLSLTKFNFAHPKNNAKILKIMIPEDLNYEGAFQDIFEEYTTSYRLNKIRTTDLGSLYELSYSINMKQEISEKEFIDKLRCRNGNLNIILSLTQTQVYGV